MSGKPDFVIRFVMTPDSRKEQMQNAVKGVQAAKVPTEKIKGEAALKMNQRDNNLYVCDPFEGPAFDHLVQLGCRVVGAQCVVSCLEMDISLPRVPHPVHSMSLYGAVVTCSSIAKDQRERVHRLVQWMGGTVSKDLTECITHLIAGEVGSKKYHVAADLKKPIVLPTWIDASWEESQKKYVKGTSDELIEFYKCPIFKGCNVCVTGFQMDDKKKILKAITDNGGIYSKELKFKESTHLIVGGTKGPKYEYAKKWKIHCVSIQWLFDGLEKGYSCDESLYPPESAGAPKERQTSTPVKDGRMSDFRGVDISTISSISNFSSIDETAMTNATSTFNTTVTQGHESDVPLTLEGGLHALEQLKLDQTHTEPFLDGCKIYLSELTTDFVEKVRRVINAGGGTRLSQLNDAVTHVLIGERVTANMRHFHAKSPDVFILNLMWIVDSYRRGQRQQEDRYTIPEFVKETAVLTEVEKRKSEALPASKKLFTAEEKPDELLSQYLPDSEVTLHEGPTETGGNDNDEDETVMEVDGGDDGMFMKKIFTVVGFTPEEAEQIQNQIMDANGKIVTESSRSIPDFAVVPLEGCEVKRTVGEVVTLCWLEMCLEATRCLPTSSNYLFKPVTLKEGLEPLSECVISFSQYSAAEKQYLSHLAFQLGATCQDYFQRKPKKNIKANTHLVIEEPEGSKYQASKKWGLPAVTKEWLFHCAKEGVLVPEERFLVDRPESPPRATNQQDQVVNNEPSPEFPLTTEVPPVVPVEGPPAASNSTPKRSPLKDAETFKTPNLAQLNLNSAKRPCSNSSERSANKMRRGDVGRINPAGTPATPGLFLKPDHNFLPKFTFDTPLSERPRRRKSSVPYEVCLYENLKAAVKTTGGGGEDMDEGDNVKRLEVLQGLAVYVSESLGQRRGELTMLVQCLGGDLRWSFDNTCTHFVFQGKSNSSNKEFRRARKADVHIVSPEWLTACQEAERRMDEKLYPHTLNPNMSLSLSQVQVNETSSPALRKSRRSVRPPTDTSPPPKEVNDLDLSMEDEQLMIAEAEAVEDKENSESSQEQRKEFQRQFAQIMSATGGDEDNGRRRSRRQVASVSGPSMEKTAAVKENRRSSRRLTRSRSKVMDQEEEAVKDRNVENDSERITITWDDASSRVCRENALARLREEDTQDAEGDKQNEDLRKAEIKEFTEQGNFNASVEAEESPSATKTPPPIRLPNANPAVAPEPCDPDQTQLDPPLRRAFLFTGLSEQERISYGALIEQLGGEVLEKSYYTHSCTHMIVGTPTKNEKYLAAVAAGKWILHRSYMVECQKEGRFIEEEPHELNSSMFPENMTKIFPLCNAPRRWREMLSNDETDQSGAFDDWKVLLVVEDAKEKGLKRILEAGGGTVLATRPPFPASPSEATHLLISNSKAKATKELIDYEDLLSSGVLCLRPEYLADFLIKDPSPDPSAYITPDIRAMLEKLMESTTMSSSRNVSSVRTPQKRGAREPLGSDSSTKRTRRT